MKKLIITMAALFAVGYAVQSQAQYVTMTPQYEDAVQVNGKAEKKVTPDEIYVAVTLRTGDIKNQSVDQLESRMKSELAALGIDVATDLRVTSMANTPQKRNDVDNRRSYELKVGDVWTLDSVFRMLGGMGVADARVTKVSHSRMEDFRREVRVEAMKNAQETAGVLAEAVGQSVGPAVWIVDNGYYENSPMPVMARAYKGEVAMDSVYEAGTAEQGLDMQDITLTYNIMAKFVLNRK